MKKGRDMPRVSRPGAPGNPGRRCLLLLAALSGSTMPLVFGYHVASGNSRLLFWGKIMSNTRIITCALAIAGVLFVGGQAPAAPDKEVTVTNTPLPVTVTNPTV